MYKIIFSWLELQLWTFYIINTLKNSNIAQSCFLVSRVVEEFSRPKEAAGMHQNGMRAQNTFRGITNLCFPSNIKTQRNLSAMQVHNTPGSAKPIHIIHNTAP